MRHFRARQAEVGCQGAIRLDHSSAREMESMEGMTGTGRMVYRQSTMSAYGIMCGMLSWKNTGTEPAAMQSKVWVRVAVSPHGWLQNQAASVISCTSDWLKPSSACIYQDGFTFFIFVA